MTEQSVVAALAVLAMTGVVRPVGSQEVHEAKEYADWGLQLGRSLVCSQLHRTLMEIPLGMSVRLLGATESFQPGDHVRLEPGIPSWRVLVKVRIH